MAVPVSQQIAALAQLLETLRTTVADERYDKVIKWVRDLPPASRPEMLVPKIAKAFNTTEEAVRVKVEMKKSIPDFDTLIPKEGWLREYYDYTLETEPPTVFHFFAGAVAIGSTLKRNVYIDQGAYNIYPNLCVVVVAPSGKCRKTSACNLGVDLYRRGGGNVLADKTTPEALVAAFEEGQSATGLIYAPELAVFLGKQKYQEGMVPMLTRLFECPDEWSSQTIGRGGLKLFNVGLSFLAASTMDWIQTAIPRDAFGGGFMSRLLFVVQHETPRVFPRPPHLSEDRKNRMVSYLQKLTQARGEVVFDRTADEWWDHWYRTKEATGDDKQYSGYFERKPDHLMRLAIVMKAAVDYSPKTLSASDLQGALNVLDWVEAYLPSAFGEMGQTAKGEENMRLIAQIKRRGGVLDHSTWLRLNSNRMDGRQFREAVETLRAAGFVEYDSKQKVYLLTPEGWNR